MDTWLIVLIVVAALVVLALVALALARRSRNDPRKQAQAREHLEQARLHGARAEREQAAAEETAARARRERAEVEMRSTEAEQEARERAAHAERERAQAAELRAKAKKLSPHVLDEPQTPHSNSHGLNADHDGTSGHGFDGRSDLDGQGLSRGAGQRFDRDHERRGDLDGEGLNRVNQQSGHGDRVETRRNEVVDHGRNEAREHDDDLTRPQQVVADQRHQGGATRA
ncbi:hypothetical protein [Goekera deserti]|uniref:hypothetical protein n=1 Tax=Goekera deserti TaxID=2497753 RepID=UPI001878C17E|nr:hypothetical protein [Goekera deserti]